jgi:hypothetical protein
MKGNGMELAEYSEIVQYWGNQVLENRGKNAELTLKFCTDIINYGMKNGDDKLMGFGYYYRGETYYCLNDGNRFIEEISQALSCLNKAEEWELMAKCYNCTGLLSQRHRVLQPAPSGQGRGGIEH